MSDLLYDVRDGVTVITINRPERRNAMNVAVRDGLRDAWRRFEVDDGSRVAILTAAGDRAFCAGRDLKDAEQLGLVEVTRDYIPILGVSVNVSKPVIAAVNGPAFGAGFIFAQMCDMCVASEHATFAIPEVKMGRGVPWAVPLARMIPQKVMVELLLTGAPISARRAYEIGLVNHVVPAGRLMDKAMELARAVIASAPLSVAASRRMLQMALDVGQSEALDRAYALFKPVYDSKDAMEGVQAFAEKRAPKWEGR